MNNTKLARFLWIIPCALTLGLYWKAIYFGFVWDDFHLIDDLLPYYKTWDDAFNKQGIFGLPIYYYRPLFFVSFMLERMFWGVGPDAFHTSMVVSNVLSTFLTYWIPLKILEKERGAHWAALICSLLFASHPIHTEVVAWISGRPDAFLALFLLASFFFYLKYRENLQRKRWLNLSLLGYFLALLNKETAAPFFFSILLYDHFFPLDEKLNLSRQERKRLRPKRFSFYNHHFWFGGVLLLYLVLRHQYLSKIKMPGFANLPIIEIFQRELAVLGLYIQKIFYPVHLNAFIAEVPNGNILMALGGAFVLIFLSAGFFSFWKNRGRLIFFNLFFFLATLLPALALAILPVAKTVAAERYLYLPVFGIFFLVGLFFIRWPASEVLRNSKIILTAKGIVVCGMIGVLSAMTYFHLPVWNSEYSFWIEMAKQNPEEGLPLQNLAGGYQRIEDIDTAMVLYEKALKAKNTTEGRAVANNAMGVIQITWKNNDAAIEHFKKAIVERPTYVHPYCNLGWIYHRKSEDAAATAKQELLTQVVHYLEGCVKRSSDPEKWKERLQMSKEELKKLSQ